jgi:predicted metal-binding membrane protein
MRQHCIGARVDAGEPPDGASPWTAAALGFTLATIMSADSQAPRAPTRNWLVGSLLLALAAGGSWIAVAILQARMDMSDAAMSTVGMRIADRIGPAPWSFAHAATVFALWAAMMAAMMIPVAAPVVLSDFARARPRFLASSAAFVAGYLTIWLGAALVGTVLQWALESAALLSPETMAIKGAFAPALLIVAGVYQWMLPKDVCLARCRLARHAGDGGFAQGVNHGLVCLGCCWALMLLMFAGAMQSLFWMAALTAFIILERTLANPRAVARGAGAAAIIAGLWWLSGAVG